jgi:hypothetical protein
MTSARGPVGAGPPRVSMPVPDAEEFQARVDPDAPDDRDLAYVASRSDAELPTRVGHEAYRRSVGATWHQRGLECTGFALAAIVNHLIRTHHGADDRVSVSRRMLYELAQLHDGEDYETGSTLRGALKGWQRVGAALDELWPYAPGDEDGRIHGGLTLARVLDGRSRRPGQYRRIVDGDVRTMQAALAEGHVLFVNVTLHVGWYRLFLPDADPVIVQRPGDAEKGGHAVVIAGYDQVGFWIHNSWGPEWGTEGFAVLPYEAWERHRRDVWVPEIGPPHPPVSGAPAVAAAEVATRTYRDMWPHLVVLRDDGRLASTGLYEMDEGSVGTLLYLFGERTAAWERPRLAIVADGGPLSTASTIERLVPLRDRMLSDGIYPLFVVWETAWWADLEHELATWVDRIDCQVASVEDPADRGAVEPATVTDAVGRSVSAAIWHAIDDRSRAALATSSGGLRKLIESVAYKRGQRWFDLHLVSHGAGDALLRRLATELPAPITSVTAVASTTTLSDADAAYGTMLRDGRLEHLRIVVQDREADRADRIGPIPGSALRWVAEVIGMTAAAPGVPVRLLGRVEDVDAAPELEIWRPTIDPEAATIEIDVRGGPVGAVPQRAPVGHGARGLLRERRRLGGTSPTTRRGRGPTAGARTASPGSATTTSGCACAVALERRDPILKERLFGLTNAEGNHGEDVKEYYFFLDNVPTHSYQRYLYKYPQAAFPYETSSRRTRAGPHEMEYELIDTGVFDENRYFDVEVEYAKAGPRTCWCGSPCHNRGPEDAPMHLLPTLWFRNTWSWAAEDPKPGCVAVGADDGASARARPVSVRHLPSMRVAEDGGCCSATTRPTPSGSGAAPNATEYVKDGIGEHVVDGRADTVNPDRTGTKAAAHVRFTVPAGGGSVAWSGSAARGGVPTGGPRWTEPASGRRRRPHRAAACRGRRVLRRDHPTRVGADGDR